jgi:hypothetical protein
LTSLGDEDEDDEPERPDFSFLILPIVPFASAAPEGPLSFALPFALGGAGFGVATSSSSPEKRSIGSDDGILPETAKLLGASFLVTRTPSLAATT